MSIRRGSSDGSSSESALVGTGLWPAVRDPVASLLTVQALASGAAGLEPLSESAVRLVTLLSVGLWDPNEVMSIVAYDRTLATRVIRDANASCTESFSAVGNVHTATMRLGKGRVVGLAVGSCMRPSLAAAGARLGLAEGALWRHSVASALAAERLVRYVEEPLPAETPVAAMLHEIGVLVIEASLPPAQLARLRDDPRRGWSFARRVEREVLGTDHAMLGGALASHWGLPSLVVDAIVHHHDPQAVAAPHHALAACAVSVADMVAVTIGAGLGAREENLVDEGSALPHLGLTGDDFSALCTEVYDELENALVRFE